jgi:hypothetical protein
MIKNVWVLFFVLLVCTPTRALCSDEQIQNYILYPYQTGFSLQEDFVGALTSSGSVGNLGMGTANGTTTSPASETSRPGLLRRDTSAVINTVTSTYLYPHSSLVFASDLPHRILWVIRLNTNDADTQVRIGAANSITGLPPGTGIYFEKLGADTNWFCVTESGAITRTDSGVAVNTSFTTFEYRRTSAQVDFLINGVQVCSNTTNLPTALFNPFTQLYNLAAASKTMDHDYFEVNVQGLTR